MRTIIAGSRTVKNIQQVQVYLSRNPWVISEVVCGKAKGPDTYGERWAQKHDIQVEYFPADWEKFGKAAGMIRNTHMAEYAQALVAFWDGQSKGTRNMIDQMMMRNKVVLVIPSWLLEIN